MLGPSANAADKLVDALRAYSFSGSVDLDERSCRRGHFLQRDLEEFERPQVFVYPVESYRPAAG